MKRERGRADAFLYVTGREIEEERELALKWDANLASCAIVGDAAEYKLSEERAEVVRTLEETGMPMTPTEVADALGKSTNTVKVCLWRMAKDGQLDNNGGRYTVNNGNPGNPVTEEGGDGYSVTGVTVSRTEPEGKAREADQGRGSQRVMCIHNRPGGEDCYVCDPNHPYRHKEGAGT